MSSQAVPYKDEVVSSEIAVTDLSVTRFRAYGPGRELKQEKFSVVVGEELLIEDANWIQAEQVIAEHITKDQLNA